jgi:hypothetical protein
MQLFVGERYIKKKHRTDICRCPFDFLGKRDSNPWNNPLSVNGMVSATAKPRAVAKAVGISEEMKLYRPRCASRGLLYSFEY